ncbi:MAG: nicotinate-nucleotide--dimethylbenzimidazole phosphoribosyltransferase, partial [Rhodospirillaceae bacterium]|nr:nicotinate-nucleotide--dimethylbenzimidazole phosphoribosyltransferase [Rhodospirillaceae bacterium]
MPQTYEELRLMLTELPQADGAARADAKARNDLLTKPQGALGRLEDLALWLAAWQGREVPRLDKVQ